MMARGLYTTLLTLATPLALARLGWKGRANPAYRERIPERFGFIPRLPARPRLWVHAVSVGEVIAAAPLIRAWRARHPDWAVLLTTTTPTGAAQVRRLFGEDVEHLYLPYDLPGAVRRFFARTRPSLGVIMETELWPNLAAEGAQRGIPLVLANARLSERSMRGYARVRPLVRNTLACFALIAARGPEDAARFIALGAPPKRVEALGNLKFDLELAPEVVLRGRQWRTLFGTERPVWIAASTHPGEETQVLEAHRRVLAEHPHALLLLAPRHPERVGEVVRLIEAAGLGYVLRSGLPPLPQPLPPQGGGGRFEGEVARLIETANSHHTACSRIHALSHSTPFKGEELSSPPPSGGRGGGRGGAPEPAPAAMDQAAQVLVIDTLGELMDFYAASDLAFVGGSLVAHGGHNPLEPAALGLPIISGPQVANFAEVYAAMFEAKAALKVEDAQGLGQAVAALLDDADERQTLGAAARAWLETHRGALGRLLERLETLATSPIGPQPSP
ncbi:MAG: 3-deoxy-D-manno-octulosonic acid transferase [Pseudomonadota bacterium]